MQMLAGRLLFTVGGRAYGWEDVVLAGHLWDRWATLERRVRGGLACLARLDDLEDDEPGLDDEDVDAAAAEFRYARDLVAAEDMEAWLTDRGLTTDDWLDWIRRSLLLQQWADDVAEIEEEYELDEDEVAEALISEALCGGHAAEMSSALAARAAVYARIVAERGDAGDGVTDEEVATILRSVPATDFERLCGLSADAARQRLAGLARIEAVWRTFVGLAASPKAVDAMIAGRSLDWMRLIVRAVSVADRDIASEIALCVREDGRDLADVAGNAGATVAEAEWYVEDVDPSFRDLLVGAKPGELVGPVAVADGFALISVVGKESPSTNDTAVRSRAERVLLSRTVDREVEGRVTWHRAL
jgi:hypothetical protein